MAIIEHAGYYENPMYNVCHTHTSCEIMHIVSGKVKIVTGDIISVLYDGYTAIIKADSFIATADIGVNMWQFSYHYIGSISGPYQPVF